MENVFQTIVVNKNGFKVHHHFETIFISRYIILTKVKNILHIR